MTIFKQSWLRGSGSLRTRMERRTDETLFAVNGLTRMRGCFVGLLVRAL